MKKTLQILFIFTCFYLPFYTYAGECAFNIPSNEEITLQGNKEMLRTLSCKINPDTDQHYQLNMVSEDNSSMINNFLVSEGAIVSMIFDPNKDNNIDLVIGANAKLNIMNDSLDTIHFSCMQF